MTPKANFITRALSAKKNVENRLQGVGRTIAGNVSQGQKDLASGKISTYSSINPFK